MQSNSRANRGPVKGAATPAACARRGEFPRWFTDTRSRRHRSPSPATSCSQPFGTTPRTLQLDLDGKSETVLIQQLQHDHLGSSILHVDFRRVSADERIRTSVAINLRGTAPGMNSGGVLDQPLHSIHIECPALAIPDSIRVKIDMLQVGQVIHVKEIELPAGVKALDDPDLVVVQVKQQVVAAEPAPIAPVEGAVEPEVITKKKEKPAEEEE